MKRFIKIAAIHSRYLEMTEEADPASPKFDFAAPRKFVEEHVNKTLAFLHEAGKDHVDLVCTHEDFLGASSYCRNLDHPDIYTTLAEEIPGPVSQRLGEVARQYKMYIAANYYERAGSTLYNTAVLIDRNGRLAGKYRKVHLADGERWRVAGGQEFPVFDTDIGKIGFAICYDIIFPEHCRLLTVNGADIIIHQTQGWGVGGKAEAITGEAFMRTRAAENSVYLIVAKNMQSDGGKSCIVDNSGNILAESQGEEGLTIAEFAADYDMTDEYNLDNFYGGVPSTKARQLLARVPERYTRLTEVQPPVLGRFKGMELATGDKAKKIISRWNEIDQIERMKYHW